MPAVSAEPVPDMSSHAGQSQVEYPRPPLQGGLPLYQPGGSLASWGSSPPTANGSGLGMPMYWQGFYPPSGGLPGGMPGGLPGGIPHLQPPPLLRPPPGLSMPYSMQQPFQYPGINASLPSVPQNISGSNTSGSLNFQGSSESMPVSSTFSEIPQYIPPISGSLSLSSISSASTMAPIQANTLTSSMPQNRHAVTSLPVATSVSKLDSVSMSSKPKIIPVSNLVYQAIPQSAPSTIGLPNSSQVEASMPSLVTSGKLLQSKNSTVSSSQPLPLSEDMMVKDKVPNVQDAITEPLKSAADESNQPILPLPAPLDRKV